MVKIIESIDEFSQYIKGSVIVDFYADWCPPCQMLGKILEEISSEVNVPIIKVNTDKFPELAQDFGIYAIPHLVFFKDGEVVETYTGLLPKEQLLDLIKRIYG
jgi:thioredoxin 1